MKDSIFKEKGGEKGQALLILMYLFQKPGEKPKQIFGKQDRQFGDIKGKWKPWHIQKNCKKFKRD